VSDQEVTYAPVPAVVPGPDPDLAPWAEPPPGGSTAKGTRYFTRTAAADVDAAQAATLDLGTPPAGWHWKVERGAFVVPGLAGDTILWLVFVGAVQDDSLKDFAEDVIGGVARTSRIIGEWSPRIHVPPNRHLFVTVADADGAGQAIVALDIEEEPD